MPSPDHRHAIRRARKQPRTCVTATNRGITMNICNYNVRTLNDDNLDLLLSEVNSIKWDIIGLSETKLINTEVKVTDKEHLLFTSGNLKQKRNGTGFLVHKSLKDNVIAFIPMSDRLSVLKIRTKTSKIIIIQVYFPTTQYPDDEVEELYNKIQNIIDQTPIRDTLIISGDFNAKVGGLKDSHQGIVGHHTTSTANERGKTLANFCSRNQLCITNTFFRKRRLNSWTSPNSLTKNQIDFIIVRKQEMNNVKDSCILKTPDISDHNMIRMKFKIRWKWNKPKYSKKLNLNSLNDSIIKSAFQLELKNKFSILQNLEDPESTLEGIESSILDSAKKTIPQDSNAKPEWMTSKTKSAIENKKKIRKSHGEHSAEYKIAKAETKKLIKKDKIQSIEKECDDISKLPPNKQFYAAIKKLKQPRNRTFGWGIKAEDGSILTDKDKILEEWAKFYETLYNDSSTQHSIDDSSELSIPSFTISEVENAIRQLKYGKAPGIDGIHSELLSYGGRPIAEQLLKLFNQILRTGKIPENFKKAIIVVIFKKGDRLQCKNYRPISLLNHTYKVFMLAIASRVKSDLYSFFPRSQAAYQPGRTTLEQIISLQQMVEKSIEFNTPLYAVFIDFKKAFDSIKLNNLWEALAKTSINKRYINLLKQTYLGSTSKIKTDIGETRFIKILKGVKQGDILAAILFCILLATVILKTEEECQSGYRIGGHNISDVGYADDIAAISDSEEKLQEYIRILETNAAEVGLMINIEKTKSFTTEKDKQINMSLQNQTLEQVENFIYLGHNISCRGDHAPALDHRISLGWRAVNKNKILLTSKRIPLNIKTKIYKTYVSPVITYGLEAIAWTEALENKLEIFQNKIMRMMTNHKLSDKISIENLRKKTNLPPLISSVKRNKIRLFGHLKRSEKGVAKICIEGNVPGKRGRGRPRHRWRDDITNWTGISSWTKMNKKIQNRKEWRKVVWSQSA